MFVRRRLYREIGEHAGIVFTRREVQEWRTAIEAEVAIEAAERVAARAAAEERARQNTR